MLVPGEYLLMSAQQEALPRPQSDGGEPSMHLESPNVEATAGVVQESESRSFLLILLRALGTIHT